MTSRQPPVMEGVPQGGANPYRAPDAPVEFEPAFVPLFLSVTGALIGTLAITVGLIAVRATWL